MRSCTWPGQVLTAAMIGWGLALSPHSRVTSARTALISIYQRRRPRHREVKPQVKGIRLVRDKDEPPVLGVSHLPWGPCLRLPALVWASGAWCAQTALMPSLLSISCLGLASGRPGWDYGAGPWLWSGAPTLLLHSLGSGTCPLPFPLQPCSGTTLALTTWGFCSTPCWFPKFRLHLGSPFVRLFSSYLLLTYHLILAGALNETPTDSAVSIFNIYWKDEKIGILMRKVLGDTQSLAPWIMKLKVLRWKRGIIRLSPYWPKARGHVSVWRDTEHWILFLCYFQRAWIAF